tara:strand:+ start:222 stop:671 length:450 start_codon:yes stop_codon:yes gene_type:complete
MSEAKEIKNGDIIEVEVCLQDTSEASLDQKNIDISLKIVDYLKSKQKEYNSNNNKKVSFNNLKQVFCNSEASFKNQEEIQQLNIWSIASVSMYFRMVNGEFNFSSPMIPSQEDISSAEKDIEKYDLNFNFKSISNLYIEPKGNIEYFLW